MSKNKIKKNLSECAILLFKILSSDFLHLNLLSSFSYSTFPSPNSIYHRHGQKALFMENLHSLHTHLWYMQSIWPLANRSEGTFQPPSFIQSSLHFVPNFSDRRNHSTQKKPTEAQWAFPILENDEKWGKGAYVNPSCPRRLQVWWWPCLRLSVLTTTHSHKLHLYKQCVRRQVKVFLTQSFLINLWKSIT